MRKKVFNKNYLIISVFILIILSGLIFIFINNGSKNSSTNDKVSEKNTTTTALVDDEIKIIFDANGGSRVESQIIKAGEKVSKPIDPTRDGYTFVGWTLNDNDYDFESIVNNEITLKAIWEKNKQEDVDNVTTTTKKASSNTTKVTSKRATIESNINKINLNENISVIQKSPFSSCAYSYMFITNLEEVYPNITGNTFSIDNPDGQAKYSISPEEWSSNFSKLKFDTEKENNAVKVLEKMKNAKYKGFKNFSSGSKDHMLSYSYLYLTPSDGVYYKNLYEGLNKIKSDVDSQISSALQGAYKICVGGVGGSIMGQLLTENLCSEYNLTCERW